MSHRHARTALFAAAITAMLVASPAQAQIGELAGFTESMQKEYVRRDLVIFSDSLELDKPQQDILKNLFDDYETAFDEGLAKMQQRLQDMKDQLQASDQKRILSMIFVPFEEWAHDRRKLGEEYLNNVQLILNERQFEEWPGFKRRLVREKTLSKGTLSGESVNLLTTVKTLDLPNSLMLTLQPVLEEYEIVLDEALRKRNETLQITQAKMVEAMQGDPTMSLDLMDEQLRVRIRVREINDQYIDIIGSALPEVYTTEFRERALARAYPRAYRSTPSQRMYTAAQDLEDIDEDTFTNIADLAAVLDLELSVYSDQIVADTRRYEPRKHRNRVEMFVARMSGQMPKKAQDPALSTMRQRDELNNQFIELLQSMLTDEQFRSLPGAEQWLKRRNARAERAKPVQSRRGRKVREPGESKVRPDADMGVGSGVRNQKIRRDKEEDDR